MRARRFALDVGIALSDFGLRPTDMIDTQSFLWVIFHWSRIWFGGHSFGGKHDVLESFHQQKRWGTKWASRPEIVELLKDVASLSTDERKRRRAALERSLPEIGERRALLAFFDLITRPETLLLSKALWFDKRSQAPRMRISSFGTPSAMYHFDDELGHQVEVGWHPVPPETFAIPGPLFPKLNGTLAALPLGEALDALSIPVRADEAARPPQDTPEDIEEPAEQPRPTSASERVPYRLSQALEGLFMPPSEFERMLAIWRQKKNLILQGAPGVGKSFVAHRLAYSLIGYEDPNWVRMVQFHQSYSYEDFVRGYRPTQDRGFALRDGILVEFCRRALRDPTEQYVFIIDEINRGNLSKIFLATSMLLIEADKRSARWGVKLAYVDHGSEPFHVPTTSICSGR